MLARDRELLYLCGASFVAVYVLLRLVLPRSSQVPLLAGVFVATNMFSRTGLFQSFLQRLAQKKLAPVPAAAGNEAFCALDAPLQRELLTALRSLRQYADHSRASNDRRRRLFSMMSWRQQKICNDAGYSEKLRAIDSHIALNQKFFDALGVAVAQHYGISYRDYGALQSGKGQNTSSSNYRVVESLGHFVRDWTDAREIGPILDYVRAQLDKIVPPGEEKDTVVVIPGAGLGRVAHEVACHRPFAAVHAVEYSGLMHACHLYMYRDKQATEENADTEEKESASDSENKKRETTSDKSTSESENGKKTSNASAPSSIYPYVHSCSNFLSTEAQLRPVDLTFAARPENLHLSLADFRYFSIPKQSSIKNVVVVSVFFLDTAENLIDYFDAIQSLTHPSGSVQNGYWINVGPLKYGSAAQAELNATEIAHVRRSFSWKDLDVTNSIEEPSKFPNNGLVGYITDLQSLWQGFYGLSMWTSAQTKNKRKIKA
ncbi:N2227-like family protein [Clavispora lusitaniae]|uniref:N2227-like family protein n=1 Tax=Clavispora lusitaniae TaxID=36911 RepID=UPI00202BD46F|nr:N2227-like family protein [Clavispora lusitaniae]